MTTEFWIGAFLTFTALVVAYAALALTGRLPRRDGEMRRLHDLESTVRVLQRDHVLDQKRIEQLEKELGEAKQRIQFLEGQLTQQGTAGHNGSESERTLLAVVGGDPALKADLAALREVEAECGVTVTRCFPVRFTRFAAVLNRYRASGTPIQYVHFSVHAQAAGNDGSGALALFDDGPVTGEQLSGVMNGVLVAFVAGCESDILGDLLGVVPAVVTFREPVRHEHATLATKLFWLAIGRGLTAREAYRETRSRLPSEVAEFLELHQ